MGIYIYNIPVLCPRFITYKIIVNLELKKDEFAEQN